MRLLAGAGLALGIALTPGAAQAQAAWPERPITFIVPYAPGGYTDLTARLTARYVEKALGKPVVVDSRPGVGAISVAPFAQKVGYDPVKDLAPVSIISTIVQAVVVKKALPVKSMAELVAYAKANPGKLNFGSSGAGGLTHFSVELFQARTGTHMVHIPFKGGAPAMAAVLSGDIDLSFANMTDALPQIEADTVRGLAVTSLERSPYFPNLPSIHETVVPHFTVETWNAIIAPPATPDPIVQKMAAVLIKMADDPEIIDAMRKLGGNTVKSTPEQFRAQINQEIEQWKPLIKEIAEKEKK